MNEKICFLTSNEKKAQDFLTFGLGVKEFSTEILEVLSPNVETVVLYKAKDTGLNNIVVEDTSLAVEGTNFWGTEIKHVYEEIKDNIEYHGRKSIWEVSLCMRKDDNFYIATGKLEGILKYPAAEVGYHFDRILAIPINNEHIHFEFLTAEQKLELGPRFQALRKLSKALKTDDFSELKIINIKDVPEWNAQYQVEVQKTNKKFKLK